MRWLVTRDVTPAECHWLSDETVTAGTTVYRCNKPTYGCIGNGFAATLDPEGGYPFFELPWDAIKHDSD